MKSKCNICSQLTVTSFAVYVLSNDKHVLDARVAFVSLTLFQSLGSALIQLLYVFSDVIPVSFMCSSLQVDLIFATLERSYSLRFNFRYHFPTQVFVSLKRIARFLNAKELDPNATTHEPRRKLIIFELRKLVPASDVRHPLVCVPAEPVIVENGRFSWMEYDVGCVLRNVNIKVEAGKLVAIVGTVGSGKSSLLSAILGDMYKQSGYVNTTVSYFMTI